VSWIAWTGCAGLAVVVVGWLVVSFSRPGPRRERVEWLAACGLYVALLMLFVHLVQKALASDSTLALLAFGFLAVLFAFGLLVCLAYTLGAFRAPDRANPSATN
jgi:protein-S-isoprenylcysteine O-methyltransferase Ste14